VSSNFCSALRKIEIMPIHDKSQKLVDYYFYSMDVTKVQYYLLQIFTDVWHRRLCVILNVFISIECVPAAYVLCKSVNIVWWCWTTYHLSDQAGSQHATWCERQRELEHKEMSSATYRLCYLSAQQQIAIKQVQPPSVLASRLFCVYVLWDCCLRRTAVCSSNTSICL